MGVSLAERLAREGSGSPSSRRTPRSRPVLAFTREAPRAPHARSHWASSVVTDHVVTRDRAGRDRRRARCSATTRPASGRPDSVVLVTQRLSRRPSTASSSATPEQLAPRGDHRAVPHRRLRGAAADRRLHLRRPPSGARDRHRRPGQPAAVHSREHRVELGQGVASNDERFVSAS